MSGFGDCRSFAGTAEEEVEGGVVVEQHHSGVAIPKVDEDDEASLAAAEAVMAEATAVMDVAVPAPENIIGNVVLQEPRLVVLNDFVSQPEADYLIRLAEGRWARSTVSRGREADLHDAPHLRGLAGAAEREDVAGEAAEAKEARQEAEMAYLKDKFSRVSQLVSSGRTSSSVTLLFDETPVVERIQARIAQLTGYPLSHVEPLVMVRYLPGGRFSLHHDGSSRPVTIFAYLNDVASGGQTRFPALELQVVPKRGVAVMWNNTLEDGSADHRMDHEAIAMGPEGVKYGINCFVNRYQQRDCSHINLVLS